MGDKQILQRGRVVKVDSKGKKTARPMEDGEFEARVAANERPFGAELATSASDATVGRMQRLPNRRDETIDKATAYKKGGSVGRGDGIAQRGKTRGKFV